MPKRLASHYREQEKQINKCYFCNEHPISEYKAVISFGTATRVERVSARSKEEAFAKVATNFGGKIFIEKE